MSLNTYALKVLLTVNPGMRLNTINVRCYTLSAIHMYAYMVHLEPTTTAKNIMNTIHNKQNIVMNINYEY